MLISEALAHAAALTGQAVDAADAVRWLSELDGRLALELGGPAAPAPYDPAADAGRALRVPFPWDGLYVHYLEAMTYYSCGEYDRYEPARIMCRQTLKDYRHYLRRSGALPDFPAPKPLPGAGEAGGGA